MKALILQQLLAIMITYMERYAPDLLKAALDKLLDFIEDTVVSSDNKADDAIVLPICRMMRETFEIPDD